MKQDHVAKRKNMSTVIRALFANMGEENPVGAKCATYDLHIASVLEAAKGVGEWTLSEADAKFGASMQNVNLVTQLGAELQGTCDEAK